MRVEIYVNDTAETYEMCYGTVHQLNRRKYKIGKMHRIGLYEKRIAGRYLIKAFQNAMTNTKVNI